MNAPPVNKARSSPPNALCTCGSSVRLKRKSGFHCVKNLLMAIARFRRNRLGADSSSNLALRPRSRFFSTIGTRLI